MTAPRPRLGVVSIAYNEARDIPGFLDNLVGWVDEIVIVDDGSTDQTAQIAAGYGEKVKFIASPRKDGEYYSHQRNKGIAAAESDWLLHMDIDERVPPDLANEVLEAIRDPGMDAFRYRRLNYFMHRPMQGGGWDRWNLVHLARRQKFRFGGMYHEDCIVDAPAERIGQLSAKMIHFNEEDFEKRLKKSGTYLEEITAGIERRGRPVRSRDILLRPIVEFVKKYFLQRGYRDGVPGLIWSMHGATAVFRAHALVWDRENRLPRDAIERDVQRLWDEAEFDGRVGP